jgi:hypothetical protein
MQPLYHSPVPERRAFVPRAQVGMHNGERRTLAGGEGKENYATHATGSLAIPP